MSGFCKSPGCENYREGNTEFCATHNHLFRKEHRESLKEKKVYVIPKTSKKMVKELKTYSEKKKEHLAKHPDCQIRLKDICRNDRETNTVHHSAKRGKNLTNEKTFLTACIPCHDYVEFKMSAAERREKGLLK